ncbi:phage major capsid protein [Clostridium saccharoperbutylacetonicum]|uniref:phage major capsid protein n=1 Tax=Clostridium saccharoperbutylacetonicum TaxID=36745 RepID=UPI000983FA13|nr:phage major capsid protein [Clostridium saccharoperbutylacetonicum]AQR98121.1 phage capsid family protein [Clostridium saccharoperbutylacetonicum]NSB34014.1 HK97 family phage major capsid protein [Clostridium saccharoperbutylacetonicum]
MKNVQIKKILEIRALPPLLEKRNDLLEEMEALTNKANEETRSLNEEEIKRFNEIKEEIRGIDETLKIEEETRQYIMTPGKKKEVEETRSIEETNFLKYVKGEERALSVGDNGGIIPQSIANKIIVRVKELSPIYALTTIYNVNGDLIFPVYDEGGSAIVADYVEDLTELNEATGKFTTVKLTNYIVGCLAKVSKSLINRQDFDLLSFIVDRVALAISQFIERELITGSVKMSGLETCANVLTTAGATISADELIDVQMEIPEIYQSNSVWIMHKTTLKAIRKLKDTTGEYLLNKDLTTAFGWTLLGKPVYVTESCNVVLTGKKVVFYGDMSGLYTKLTKNVELQILNEKYATQHAVGCVGYVELDSKIVEPQKLVALKMK